MGDVNFVDKSRKPRTVEEIVEARQAIVEALVKINGPPQLLVFFPTIKDALDELLHIRKRITEELAARA